jgi:hypothetical protein
LALVLALQWPVPMANRKLEEVDLEAPDFEEVTGGCHCKGQGGMGPLGGFDKKVLMQAWYAYQQTGNADSFWRVMMAGSNGLQSRGQGRPRRG